LVAHHEELGMDGISESNVGEWIKARVDRVNVLVSTELGIPVLTLLESFLQCRLRPRFEGFVSQQLKIARSTTRVRTAG
jgi:hypothetical protein